MVEIKMSSECFKWLIAVLGAIILVVFCCLYFSSLRVTTSNSTEIEVSKWFVALHVITSVWSVHEVLTSSCLIDFNVSRFVFGSTFSWTSSGCFVFCSGHYQKFKKRNQTKQGDLLVYAEAEHRDASRSCFLCCLDWVWYKGILTWCDGWIDRNLECLVA